MALVSSLLDMEVNIEVHGDGSKKAQLVAQAARQTQAAQAWPCSTMEWLTMATTVAGVPSSGSVNATTQLTTALYEVVSP